jgi:ATP-binding cassette subfamily B protein
MDPWAEHDWLQRFRKLAAGQTTLIITHRFTTAMYADRIHVMEEGQIVESGSHAELLALGGRYAQSWQAQMQTAYANAGQLFPYPEKTGKDRANGTRKDKVLAQ